MSAEIASTPYVPAGLSPKTEKRERTIQGNDVRVAPVRQSSDADKLQDAMQEKLGAVRDSLGVEPRGALNLDVRLNIDQYEPTGDYIYRFVEQSTGEQIRQWPREDMLKLAEKLGGMDGALLDKKV